MNPLQDIAIDQVDFIMQQAAEAFVAYEKTDRKTKSNYLRQIATEIENLGDELIQTAAEETHLSETRIISERTRTTNQCRAFAEIVEEGSWVEARIDTALSQRKPIPKPDIRKMLVPIGPIVVFGAANFPLAYSTAGGDTISALAAGCSVIVKAHPAHPRTAEYIARAIHRATEKTKLHPAVFQQVRNDGANFQLGQALVSHPLTQAVGFTGSRAGGKALFDIAMQRKEPIPFFAEMSSINPVVLLPESLRIDYKKTADLLASSITLGVGQFCTNPGLLLTVQTEALTPFIHQLAAHMAQSDPASMLHQGIADNYQHKTEQILKQKGITVLARAKEKEHPGQGRPLLISVSAQTFLANPNLAEEVFGPFSMLVISEDINELQKVIQQLEGQLTFTFIGQPEDLKTHVELIHTAQQKTGRLILNGVPTGVEVCPSMQHGGPFPSTTDARFSAVGRDAIRRFTRPLAFQNFPTSLLPEELQPDNPLQITRLVNNKYQINPTTP